MRVPLPTTFDRASDQFAGPIAFPACTLSGMSITIASFDGADRTSVDEAYRIGVAVNDADLPDLPPFCRRRFDALFHTPLPGTRTLWALARLDGVPAGFLQLDLPQLDNTDNATEANPTSSA